LLGSAGAVCDALPFLRANKVQVNDWGYLVQQAVPEMFWTEIFDTFQKYHWPATIECIKNAPAM
jgi:peptidoglycan/xylan/chitin deacetylase (PgdA/CDA1 family)